MNAGKLVNICPVEGCEILGGSLFQKTIKREKTGKKLKYYYYEHRNAGSKGVSHYLGTKKPKIERKRISITLV